MNTFFPFFRADMAKAFVLASAMTASALTAAAQTLTEDFEAVTVVDADGQPLSNGWTAGSGLSNGWRIIGGTIYANDNGDYGLMHAIGKGFGLSDSYLTSSSTSVNSAYVFIPECLTGEVLLWGRSNLDSRSKKSSTLTVYEASSDGAVDTGSVLYMASPEKGVSEWKPFKFTIEGSEGKYIALHLVYTDIDDFSATIADGSTVAAELTVSAESLDFGTLSAEASQTLTVKSSVTTSVAFAISGSDRDAFSVVSAPILLPAGTEKTVEVKMAAPEPGDYRATLVITAGELTKRVTLTGTWEETGTDPGDVVTPDPNADWMGEDFATMTEVPAMWTLDGGAEWAIDDWWLDSAPALKGYSGGICTPPFTVDEGQALEFYFQKGMSYGWGSRCTVSYSDDGENWTEAESYDQYADDGTKTIELPAAGVYRVKLEVNAISYFDDFCLVTVASTGIAQKRSLLTESGTSYDLQGRPVSGARKQGGIVIVDGKKIKK